jgi:thioredoxin reductase (NADPH)
VVNPLTAFGLWPEHHAVLEERQPVAANRQALDSYTVAIAGGGVAGLSAAIFLARAGVPVAVFDRSESSLHRVSKVNNYLGFPNGVGGPDLLSLGRVQAVRFGAEVLDEDVRSVAPRQGGGFDVVTDARALRVENLILASNKRTDLATSLGIPLGGHGGRFVSVDGEGQTSVLGCYAVGRITGLPSQAIISAGDGAKVAIAIIQKIRGGYYVDHDT